MPIHVISLYFTATISLGLGIFALLKSHKTESSYTFSFMSLSVFGWSFFLGLQYHFNILFFNRVCNFFAIFIAVFWLHCVFTILNKSRQQKSILYIAYPTALLIGLICLLTDYGIPHFAKTIWFDSYPQAGPFYIVHFIFFAIVIAYSLIELLRAYPSSTGLKRQQIKYLLWASLIGFSTGMTTYPLAWQIPIYPVGIFLIWIYVPITAYAVFKYQLFDVYVILRKSLIFSLLVILTASFFGTVAFGGQDFFHTVFGLDELTVALIASAIIALIFNPMKFLVAKITDQYIFKSHYDWQKAVEEIGQAIASEIKLRNLVLLLDISLKRLFDVSSVSTYILNESLGLYIEEASASNKPLIETSIIKSDSPLVLHLLYTQQTISSQNLSYSIKTDKKNEQNIGRLTQIKDQLDSKGWVLSIPLISKNKLIGMINLGPKIAQYPFSISDLRHLTTLANQTAVAIENASVYEKEKQLSEEKSEFISVASHRLRTPLSVIKWALSLLNEEKETLSPKHKALVDKALHSNEVMVKLVNDLLNVSRIEEQSKTLKLSSIQVTDLIEKIISTFSPQAQKKELSFSLHKPDKPLPVIDVDADKIEIALENIIRNAVLYTPDKGTIEIRVKLETDSKHILISVTDTGYGIADKEQEHIFKKFYRGHNTATANTNGSGLGLFIVKNIIQDHGGKIWFESKEDKGTTFFIQLSI